MKLERRSRVTVLGAGLSGVATALELARHGTSVTLVEQDVLPMNRASLRNEGKIHLGFIYAQDHTFRTADLQLRGALQFRALLQRWIGQRVDDLRLSHSFVYLVARDSLLQPEELSKHYAAIERRCAEHFCEDPNVSYLGQRLDRLFRTVPLNEIETWVRTSELAGAFHTEERAIDTDQLAHVLRAAVRDNPKVCFLGGRTVKAVTRHPSHFQVEGNGPGGSWRLETEQVVNATWENRMAIDETVGVRHEPGWVHRLKYRVIASLPQQLRNAPSVTMVLGPYGDVVIRPDGTAYLSWYPLGLRGWTHDLTPPASWSAPCRGELTNAERQSVVHDILTAIDSWYPGIKESQPLFVDAGAIVAYGRTDVHDAHSELHDRSRIGVTSQDGYHSVDPGKLTTAPLFAELAARRVLRGD